jgi:hypothetical protein
VNKKVRIVCGGPYNGKTGTVASIETWRGRRWWTITFDKPTPLVKTTVFTRDELELLE